MDAASRTSSMTTTKKSGWGFGRSRSNSAATYASTDNKSTHSKKEKLKLSEKEKRRSKMANSNDPTNALAEEEPFAASQAAPTTKKMAPLKDANGNPITEPDRSNPTRNRWERPLETIMSFERAIDGDDRHTVDYMDRSHRGSIYHSGPFDAGLYHRNNGGQRYAPVDAWITPYAGPGSRMASRNNSMFGGTHVGPVIGSDEGSHVPLPYHRNYHHPQTTPRGYPRRNQFPGFNQYGPYEDSQGSYSDTPAPPLASSGSSNLSLSSSSFGSNQAPREGERRTSSTPERRQNGNSPPPNADGSAPPQKGMVSSPLNDSYTPEQMAQYDQQNGHDYGNWDGYDDGYGYDGYYQQHQGYGQQQYPRGMRRGGPSQMLYDEYAQNGYDYNQTVRPPRRGPRNGGPPPPPQQGYGGDYQQNGNGYGRPPPQQRGPQSGYGNGGNGDYQDGYSQQQQAQVQGPPPRQSSRAGMNGQPSNGNGQSNGAYPPRQVGPNGSTGNVDQAPRERRPSQPDNAPQSSSRTPQPQPQQPLQQNNPYHPQYQQQQQQQQSQPEDHDYPAGYPRASRPSQPQSQPQPQQQQQQYPPRDSSAQHTQSQRQPQQQPQPQPQYQQQQQQQQQQHAAAAPPAPPPAPPAKEKPLSKLTKLNSVSNRKDKEGAKEDGKRKSWWRRK